VENGENNDAVGLRDVEDRVWEAAHEHATNVTMNARVSERFRRDAQKREVDAIDEVIAQAWPARFVPEACVFELRHRRGAKDDFRGRHLLVRALTAAHSTTSSGDAACSARRRSSS